MHRPAPVPTIDVEEAARRLTAEDGDAPRPILVDVRERNEFAAIRVPGAALVPMSEFPDAASRLPRDRPLLVMCASGRRSLAVAEFLGHGGWPDVVNVDGGIIAWQRAGHPTRQGSPAPGEGELGGR